MLGLERWGSRSRGAAGHRRTHGNRGHVRDVEVAHGHPLVDDERKATVGVLEVLHDDALHLTPEAGDLHHALTLHAQRATRGAATVAHLVDGDRSGDHGALRDVVDRLERLGEGEDVFGALGEGAGVHELNLLPAQDGADDARELHAGNRADDHLDAPVHNLVREHLRLQRAEFLHLRDEEGREGDGRDARRQFAARGEAS